MKNILRLCYYSESANTVFEVGDGYDPKKESDGVQISWLAEFYIDKHPELIFFFVLLEPTTDVFGEAIVWRSRKV